LQTPPIAKQPVLILNPFWAVVVAVDEAFNPPVRTKVPLIVEEALEINPPPKVERFKTDKVEEALRAPVVNGPTTVEEAVEIKPALVVRRPLIPKVETAVEEATEIKPAFMVVRPLTLNAATAVEEALEIKPFPAVIIPVVEALAK